jgi:hypothetical protein
MQCATCGKTTPIAGTTCPHCGRTQKLILVVFTILGLSIGYSNGHGIISAILGATIAGAVGKFLLSKIGPRKVIIGAGVLLGCAVVVNLAMLVYWRGDVISQHATQTSAKSELQKSQPAEEKGPPVPPVWKIVSQFPSTAYPAPVGRAFGNIVNAFETCANGWKMAGRIAEEDYGIHKADAYGLAWDDCRRIVVQGKEHDVSDDVDIIKKAKMDDGARTRLLVLVDIAEHFVKEGADKGFQAKDWYEGAYIERGDSEVRDFTDTGKETTEKWFNASKSLDDYRKSKGW